MAPLGRAMGRELLLPATLGRFGFPAALEPPVADFRTLNLRLLALGMRVSLGPKVEGLQSGVSGSRIYSVLGLVRAALILFL